MRGMIMVIVEPQKVIVRFSGANRKHLESKGYIYTKKGDEIEIDVHDLSSGSPQKVNFRCDYCNEVFKSRYSSYYDNKNQFCSRECKCKWNTDNPRTQFITNCGYCNKDIIGVPSGVKKSKSGKLFCSNDCVGKYNSERHNDNRVNKICLICDKPYTVKPSEKESLTCSRECQAKWQSKYLIGENANNFNRSIDIQKREVLCSWCGKPELIYPYKLKLVNNGYNHFCSIDCFQSWYSQDWSQRDEWKEESRIRTVKMLEDGVFNHTDTEPQIIINKLLEELSVKYKNEYNCKYVSMDNYLEEYNLMIEVNGTFWHCDPRKYPEINYQRQVDRIKSDKIKHTYILNNYGIEILYLWEGDIINNTDLCRKLIIDYIENRGNLKNYHSLNYIVGKCGELDIRKNLIIPYSETPIDDLKNIICIDDSKRKSRKQIEKWITFNCEECATEKEQLKSKYNKCEHHFCSVSCSAIFYGRKKKQVI